MRVLVCGGREFSDRDLLFRTLDQLHAKSVISVVIHGNSDGADTLAGKWGESRGIIVVFCVADWRTYGRAAGPIRNQRMLDEDKPDLVVAFPGGKGTADMTLRARKAGIEVFEVEPS